MLKNKCKVIVFILIFLTIFICSVKVEAVTISQVEYSDEYKEWLELPEDERSKLVAPKMFDIDVNLSENKVFTRIKTLMNSVLNSRFDLREKIANNLKIRNQGSTNACWAFATLSSLETNLALKNKSKVYDYSESHMDYSTSQSFYNGEIENGFSREVSVGGNFQIGSAYLTNGQGPVMETEMEFIDTKADISIKDIKGKNVVARVTDTEEFEFLKVIGNEDMNSLELEALMIKMKEHIKSYGSISAGIHGTDLQSDCYNNETGAIYCKDKNKCPMNHNISIIGWDDEYSIDNFSDTNKPNRKGAWIIRNSWGEKRAISKTKYFVEEFKTVVLEKYSEKCKEYGWYSVEDISDEFVIELLKEAGYIIDGEYIYETIGDNGFMYVSYEDVNIYKQLFGIERATGNIDYDKIYQYNELGYNNSMNISVNKVYISNVFERDKNVNEELTEVSLNVMQNVKCKVYVNSKNESKNINNLTEVELVEGKTETFDAGYHTIEFKKPVALTGDKFAIVIEIEAIDDETVYCPVIVKTESNFWDNVVTQQKVSYITYGEYFKNNMWIDIAAEASTMNIAPSNLTIKAFTRNVEVIETPIPTQKPTTMPTATEKPIATVKPTSTPVVTPTSQVPTQKPTTVPTATVKPIATDRPTNTPVATPTSQVPTQKPITKNTPIPSSGSVILGGINTNSNSGGSTMTTHSSLPYVGKTEIIIGLIIVLAINMVIVYKKYKNTY